MDKRELFYKFVAFTASVHHVTHELTKESKPDNITPVQYSILESIKVSQPITPSQISECQHMSMPNTSRELKKLSEKSLIEKIEDDKDRRKQYICLSKTGEMMMDEVFKCTETRFLDRIQNLSNEDVGEIEHALEVLNKKIFY
ncbi:MarR family winged helix-turn-helix transcriptional regulator [Metabacillus fastidiosus]|uniref:MarR family winged helix-turn-helix transcriptional regulator n=1 Tax=Metabacillus fastidiosus TaxID=1458 RepID=UPI003D268858